MRLAVIISIIITLCTLSSEVRASDPVNPANVLELCPNPAETEENPYRLDKEPNALAGVNGGFAFDGGGLNICYADVASTLIDALRAWEVARTPGKIYTPRALHDGFVTSPIVLSLQAKSRPDLGTKGVSYVPNKGEGVENYTFMNEGGTVEDAIRGTEGVVCNNSKELAYFLEKNNLISKWEDFSKQYQLNDVEITKKGGTPKVGYVDADSALVYLANYIISLCKGRTTKISPISIDNEYQWINRVQSLYNASTANYLRFFAQAFRIGLPVGVGICENFLMEDELPIKKMIHDSIDETFPPLSVPNQCVKHKVVVVGRRINRAGQCQFLVRNSWGRNTCKYYPKAIQGEGQRNCDNLPNGDEKQRIEQGDTGQIWVNADLLIGNTTDLTVYYGLAARNDGPPK